MPSMTEPPPAAETRTVVFKLDFQTPPVFSISYKNKDELFRSFKSKLDEWQIPTEATYFIDTDGDHIDINDADALLGIAMIGADKVNVTVRGDDSTDNEAGSSPERGEMKRRLMRKGRRHSNRGQSRDHSSHRYGGCHLRDFSDTEDVRKCRQCPPIYYEPPFSICPYYEQPPLFCPLNRLCLPMDIGYGWHPSFGIGHDHRRRHPTGDMRRHFHCC